MDTPKPMPGPWRIHKLPTHTYIGSGPTDGVTGLSRDCVAHNVQDGPTGRLVAAAPDLLAAAKKAERHLTREIEYRNLEEDASTGSRDALRRAIAKAEGGRPWQSG